MLSSPFHIHTIFKLAPVLCQKNGGNLFCEHFLQLYGKNECGDPYFYFMILVRTVLPLNEKRSWHKSMFSFLAILLNCTD